MNDAEFNAELSELFATERRKQPYYIEPTTDEVRLLATSFKNHAESLKGFFSIDTVDDFLESLQYKDDEILSNGDDGDFQTPLSEELTHLLQEDAERYDAPVRGEVQVSGTGLYIQDNTSVSEDDEYPTLEDLEEGMTIIGEFKGYAVLPDIIDSEAELPDRYEADLAPWMKLYDVRILDSTGRERSNVPSVFIPISTSTFNFGKIIRRTGESYALVERQPVEIDLKTYFASEYVRSQFANAENDLNYNVYDEEEERKIRDEYQNDLLLLMEGVDGDKEFLLQASQVQLSNGELVSLDGVTTSYLNIVLAKNDKEWRVCHGFYILDGRNAGKIAHVYPECIEMINYVTAM